MAIAYIPYGAYWSSPFVRWQGAFAGLHALRFGAWTAEHALQRLHIELDQFDFGVLGNTVPQQSCFYGLPWVTGLMGADHIGGPSINQACATGARIVQTAAQEVAGGGADCALVLAADRVSNGPTLNYPNPANPGGAGDVENWVLDNFARDPYAGVAMVETAENVARRFSIGTSEQHDVVQRRHQQYESARASGFHSRFMQLPFSIPDKRFQSTDNELAGDDGVYPASREKMDRLKPVVADGTVTFAGQTHPADGNAGMVVTTEGKARELATTAGVDVAILGFGLARTERGYMPFAPVPAAQRALSAVDLKMKDIDAVKTHNPFAINDIVFARETGFAVDDMNNNGCSLIWGHPQGPTGVRLIIELIEELAMRGGGVGLFSGCAAGDTAMAVVIRVG